MAVHFQSPVCVMLLTTPLIVNSDLHLMYARTNWQSYGEIGQRQKRLIAKNTPEFGAVLGGENVIVTRVVKRRTCFKPQSPRKVKIGQKRVSGNPESRSKKGQK